MSNFSKIRISIRILDIKCEDLVKVRISDFIRFAPYFILMYKNAMHNDN